MDNMFINEALDSTIKKYMKLSKEDMFIYDKSFCIVVLKALASIYGELDIINPYIVKNTKVFKQNIIKYGCSEDLYEEFIINFDNYYRTQDNTKMFDVQKNLVDIFMVKKKNSYITEKEEQEFYELINESCSSGQNASELKRYYYEKLDSLHATDEEPRKSNILNLEAYEILNYSLTDIANMDADSVDLVNEKIYQFFEIDDYVENKADLLNVAIDNYKKYNTKLTSGNGYVDILLVMGIVITGILVLTVASFIIF